MAKMNLWREAMFRFRRAVEINPSDAMAHNNLAVAYEANGDFDKWLVENKYPASSHAGIPDTSEMLYLGGDKGWVRKELIATAVGDPVLFREMITIFARRSAAPGLDPSRMPVLIELMSRFEQARAAGELRGGMPPERAARLCLSAVFGHLLGVEATPDERRADLRALFALYVADPA
jgi:tetratricopeptide (TPR) repeat protein